MATATANRLFDPEPFERTGPRHPFEWISNGEPKPGTRYYLGRTGYGVAHCGHPTAHWPWHGVRPDGSMILSPNGLAFQFLADAQRATEAEARKEG